MGTRWTPTIQQKVKINAEGSKSASGRFHWWNGYLCSCGALSSTALWLQGNAKQKQRIIGQKPLDMAKLSGIGVIAIGGGGLLLFSAIKGKQFSSALRDVLAGKNPSNANPANPIASNYNPNGPLANTYNGTVQVAPGATETSFIKALLLKIGAPTTSANINSIAAWIQHEGPWGTQGGNGNNPLNTSLTTAPGYQGKWSAAPVVSVYGSLNDGLDAIVATLQGGGYSDIVSALKSGRGLCGQSFSGLSTWSGGGYSQVC